MCNDCNAAAPNYDAGCASQGAGLAGGYALSGAQQPGSKPSADPMFMPLYQIIEQWRRQSKELAYLRIELSREKLRVAELEHDRAVRTA